MRAQSSGLWSRVRLSSARARAPAPAASDVHVADGLAAQGQGLTVGGLGADPGQRLVGAVEAFGGVGGLAGGHVQQVAVAQARAPAGQQVGADQPGLGGQRAGGGHPLGDAVQGGDRRVQPRGPGMGLVGAGLVVEAAALDGEQADVGQRRGEAALHRGAGVPEGDLGGGVQAGVAEDLGAQQGAERLFAAGAGPAVAAMGAVEAGGGGLGAGGGLAQGHGIAGAAGDFAPDDGGLQAATRLVLGAHAAGGDVGGLGFLGQQVGIQQFQQRGIARGQPVGRRFHPLSGEEALQFAAKFEHRTAPNPTASHLGTRTTGVDGAQQSRSRRL